MNVLNLTNGPLPYKEGVNIYELDTEDKKILKDCLTFSTFPEGKELMARAMDLENLYKDYKLRDFIEGVVIDVPLYFLDYVRYVFKSYPVSLLYGFCTVEYIEETVEDNPFITQNIKCLGYLHLDY